MFSVFLVFFLFEDAACSPTASAVLQPAKKIGGAGGGVDRTSGLQFQRQALAERLERAKTETFKSAQEKILRYVK